MAQKLPTDYPIDPITTSGTALAEILNRTASAEDTQNSGATAPPETVPGMFWLDTSAAGDGVLKMRNQANTAWLTIANTSGALMIADGTVAAPGIAWTNEPGLGWYRPQTAVRSFAAAGVQVEQLNAAAAGQTVITYAARTPGSVGLFLSPDPLGSPNTTRAVIYCDAAGITFGQSIVGTGAPKPVNYAGASHFFDGNLFVNNGLATLGNGTGAATMTMNSVASSGKDIYGRSAGTNRWLMRLGDGNPNDDYVLWAYADDGATLMQRVQISRLGNGDANFTGPVNSSAGIWGADAAGMGIGVPGGRGATWRVVKESTFVRQYFTNSAAHLFSYDQALGRFAIYTSGGRYEFENDGNTATKVAAGQWAANSDERIKELIEDYTPGLAEVLQLRPRTFQFRAEARSSVESDEFEIDLNKRYTSLIAQEAETVMPELVTAGYGKMGSIELEDMRVFDPTNIMYALINAVKTLHARIETLETAAP